jgi:hypothetical protein
MLKEHDDVPPGNPKSEPRNPDKRRSGTSTFPETKSKTRWRQEEQSTTQLSALTIEQCRQ